MGNMGKEMNLATATAVWDLCAFGVGWEVGTEGLKDLEVQADTVVVVPTLVAAEEPLRGALETKNAAVETVKEPMKEPVVMPEVVPEVWTVGEAGGLVVVLKAGGVPVGAERALLDNMMKAVLGAKEMPVAFVGCVGVRMKVNAALREKLMEAVGKLAPVRLLVLGQDMVNHLAGKMVGVEGWQVAQTDLGTGLDVGAVVVTYPLELLLQRPLYKRLAWLSLMKWRE